MKGRPFLLRTGTLIAAAAILAVVTAATTVVAGPAFLKKRDYRNNEGIYATFRDGPVDLPNSGGIIHGLDLPKGNWLIVAKLWVDPNGAGGGNANVFARCRLSAGRAPDVDSDLAVLNASKAAVPGNTAAGTLAMTVVHRVPRSGTVAELACDDNGSNAQAHDIKIVAIRARSLRNTSSGS